MTLLVRLPCQTGTEAQRPKTLAIDVTQLEITRTADLLRHIAGRCGWNPAVLQQLYLVTPRGRVAPSLVQPLLECSAVSVCVRLCGGKGGLGSQLRAAGGRMAAKKSTNMDACRDLSGRRLSTMKQAEKIAAAVLDLEEERRERDAARRAKIERALAPEPLASRTVAPSATVVGSSYVDAHERVCASTRESVSRALSGGSSSSDRRSARPVVLFGDDDSDAGEVSPAMPAPPARSSKAAGKRRAAPPSTDSAGAKTGRRRAAAR